jgi:CheY-like chemotaxis protein
MNRDCEKSNGATRVPLRVLFFEDHAADVELSLWTLESAGFDVAPEVAVTLAAVIDRVSATKYDVILSDYNMPDATGMDVFRALKAEGVTVPFILPRSSTPREGQA